jgi:hypothetical protein
MKVGTEAGDVSDRVELYAAGGRGRLGGGGVPKEGSDRVGFFFFIAGRSGSDEVEMKIKWHSKVI